MKNIAELKKNLLDLEQVKKDTIQELHQALLSEVLSCKTPSEAHNQQWKHGLFANFWEVKFEPMMIAWLNQNNWERVEWEDEDGDLHVLRFHPSLHEEFMNSSFDDFNTFLFDREDNQTGHTPCLTYDYFATWEIDYERMQAQEV